MSVWSEISGTTLWVAIKSYMLNMHNFLSSISRWRMTKAVWRDFYLGVVSSPAGNARQLRNNKTHIFASKSIWNPRTSSISLWNLISSGALMRVLILQEPNGHQNGHDWYICCSRKMTRGCYFNLVFHKSELNTRSNHHTVRTVCIRAVKASQPKWALEICNR